MIDKCRSPSCAAMLFGAVFILVAILGFVPNPIVGMDGLFMTNAAHNIFHALIGVGLLAAAKTGYGKKGLLLFGIVYILLAIVGYSMKMDMLFGIIMINMMDNYLHIVLGVVLIAAGVFVREK